MIPSISTATLLPPCWRTDKVGGRAEREGKGRREGRVVFDFEEWRVRVEFCLYIWVKGE